MRYSGFRFSRWHETWFEASSRSYRRRMRSRLRLSFRGVRRERNSRRSSSILAWTMGTEWRLICADTLSPAGLQALGTREGVRVANFRTAPGPSGVSPFSRVGWRPCVLGGQYGCGCAKFGTKRPQVQILSARHVPQVADLRECRSLRPMSHSPAHATHAAKDHSVARGRCPCDAPRRRRRTGSRRTCHRGRLQTPEAVTPTWQYYHFHKKW